MNGVPISTALAQAIVNDRYSPGKIPEGYWTLQTVARDSEFAPPAGFQQIIDLGPKENAYRTILACVPRPLSDRLVRVAFARALLAVLTKPATTLGQYELNTVYCERAESFLANIPSESIDYAITSPPYDAVRDYKGFTWDFPTIACELYRILKPGGVLTWVVADGVIKGGESLTSMRQAIHFVDAVGFKMHDTMIFHDPGTSFPDPTRYTQQWEYMFVLSKGKPKTINLQTQPNKWAGDRRPEGTVRTQQEKDGSRSVRKRKPVKDEGVLGNVWTIGVGYGKSTADKIAFQHPAMFPEELARRHILTWTNEGDVVLDCFLGSGTTAKIARNLKRNWLGCEISEEYIAIARERLRQPFEQHYVKQETDLSELPLFKAMESA